MSNTNLIVTGKTGAAHISSSDDGSLHGGIFGEEDYILDRGGKLEATLSGQIVTVSSGDLIMQGRHARIVEFEQVTIEAPTNGTARYTDICFRYYKDVEDNSNESIKLVGINGPEKSSSGDPVAPTLVKGNIFNEDIQRDVRLCRVLFDTRGGTTSVTLITEEMNEFRYLIPVKTLQEEIGELQEEIGELQEDVDALQGEVQPVDRGGTGATTVDGALENLGLSESISIGEATTSDWDFTANQHRRDIIMPTFFLNIFESEGTKIPYSVECTNNSNMLIVNYSRSGNALEIHVKNLSSSAQNGVSFRVKYLKIKDAIM